MAVFLKSMLLLSKSQFFFLLCPVGEALFFAKGKNKQTRSGLKKKKQQVGIPVLNKQENVHVISAYFNNV